jgi:hypothetical protein
VTVRLYRLHSYSHAKIVCFTCTVVRSYPSYPSGTRKPSVPKREIPLFSASDRAVKGEFARLPFLLYLSYCTYRTVLFKSVPTSQGACQAPFCLFVLFLVLFESVPISQGACQAPFCPFVLFESVPISQGACQAPFRLLVLFESMPISQGACQAPFCLFVLFLVLFESVPISQGACQAPFCLPF